jgi:Flp pilus assembly protein TadD
VSWFFAFAAVAGHPSPPDGAQTRQLIAQALDHGRLLQAREMNAIERRKANASTAIALDGLDARLALAEGRHADAFSAYSKLADLAPSDCAAREGAGLAALHLGRAAGAQKLLGDAVALCPGRWRSWNALGVLADQNGRWEASAEAYTRALAIAPAEPIVLNNLGYSLVLQHRFDDAERILRKAIRVAPQNAKFANNLDIAMIAAGKQFDPDREADPPARRAARLNNAGYVSYLLGRTTAARAYFEEALAIGASDFGRAARNLEIVEQAGP